MNKQIDAVSTSLTAIMMWNGATTTSSGQPTLQDLWAMTVESNGQGFLGLVQIFADMAALTQTIWEDMETLRVFDAPGVFDYEVSENFGVWFYRELNEFNPVVVPSEQQQKAALGELIWKFFAQAPGSLHPEQYAVISNYTGYMPEDEPAGVDLPETDEYRRGYNDAMIAAGLPQSQI